MIRVKIFSIRDALQNLLFGLKDEWEFSLDDSVDATKNDETNESLKLFYFCLGFLAFSDAEVSSFFYEGREVSEEDSECGLSSSSLFLFLEDLALWCFFKEEDKATRSYFEFRLEVFESRLEEEDEIVSVVLNETGVLILFSK